MKKDDIANLIGIYIVLIGLSYCFYLTIIIVKGDISVASALLSWSATMFATIALLYIFTNWRDQKGIEVIANVSKDTIELLFNKISCQSTHQYYNDEIFISKYLDMNTEILKKLLFINECTENNLLKEKITELNIKNDSLLKNLDNQSERSINNSTCLSLIKLLKPYALYRSDIKY